MSFLITGATGFIGRHVVQSALEQGHEVAVVARAPEKARGLFGDSVVIYNQEAYFSRKVEVDSSVYDKAIHLAWADVSNYMGDGNSLENLALQKKFITTFLAFGIKDITVAGTCLEYGMMGGECSESRAVKKVFATSYAKAKHDLYSYLLDIQRQDSFINIKWLRLFYVYGEGSRSNSLLSLLNKAIENGDDEFNMSMGDQKRDFIHIHTLAHNIVAVANQRKQSGIVNIGNGKPVSVLEFVESILKIKDYKMKLNKGFYPYTTYEPHEFWADISKLKSIKGAKFDDKIWL